MTTQPEPTPPLAVKITTGPHGHNTTLEINGQKVERARSFTLTASADEATRLTIEYIGVKVDVEALVDETAMGSTNREYRKVHLVEPVEDDETEAS